MVAGPISLRLGSAVPASYVLKPCRSIPSREWQNRRAVGASPVRGRTATDAGVRRRPTSHRGPAIRDRRGSSALLLSHLCAFAPLRFWRVPLLLLTCFALAGRLCVSVSLRLIPDVPRRARRDVIWVNLGDLWTSCSVVMICVICVICGQNKTGAFRPRSVVVEVLVQLAIWCMWMSRCGYGIEQPAPSRPSLSLRLRSKRRPQ